MSGLVLGIHPELQAGGRLPALSRDGSQVRAAEWGVWLLLGVTAACASALPDWNLKIPGHAILRAIFPMALGLSLAPRRGAGGVMGTVALATSLGLRFSGKADIGLGGLTSLTLCGLLLDIALWSARCGARLYCGIVAAGLASNLIALVVKAVEKKWLGSGRSFGGWLAQAIWTYPLCGVLAGLISAAVWFRWRSRGPADDFGRD